MVRWSAFLAGRRSVCERALWVEHELAAWKFHRLQDKLEYLVAGSGPKHLSLVETDELRIEFEAIWNELSSSWISHRKQEKS
jgi:hypothetical protein